MSGTLTHKLEVAEHRIVELEAELKAVSERLKSTQEDVQYYRGISQQYSSILNETGLNVWFSGNPDDVGDTIQKVKDRFIAGEHMEMFVRLNKEHPILNDAWSKYMMSLRLIGLDGTNNPETKD